ncbi:MAG TPA: hypothetical protein VML55_16965, partial [Planctomycetaceae bacterium]|nr:hypothetical protein [Planctomycetaceae bacterium]
RAGFSKRVAQGMTGAMDEMVSNVLEHSRCPASGMAGYHRNGQTFEYAVADAGEGVLASLRRHVAYASLDEPGRALELALTDGESRFGPGSGRGYGFHQVFQSLANLGAAMRFRSGPSRLEISGISPTLTVARVGQAVMYQGFLMSVACERPGC